MRITKKLFMARDIAAFVCILGLGALIYGQEPTADDLFGDGTPPPAQSGGDGFDDASINDLFGTFEAQSEKKEEAAPARVLPPFHGNYKLVISRPIYAVYEAETKTKWISATAEIYTNYKVASFPRTQAFTIEQVDGVLPGSRDYSKRFNKQHFIDAAKKLGATHILYQEYQPHKNGKEVRFVMELYWIQEGAAVIRVSQDIVFSAFERGLDICLEKVADAMDPGAKKTAAFKNSVLGKDIKNIEAFGSILAGEGAFTSESAAATYTAADKILKKNGGLVGFQYAGALLAGRARNYVAAVSHIQTVIGKSGDYPALQLYLAEYMRGGERFSDATKAAEKAAKSPALKTPAAIEMAMIQQAQGNIDRARSEYNSIIQAGDADGRLLFRLALLSIQANRFDESEDYLRRAEESGFNLDESEYYELGMAYSKNPGYEAQALDYIKRSMGAKQSNEAAWTAIADLHNRTGNAELEADAYVNLFKINQNAHSGKIKTAGEIYEKMGNIEKAKDAYALFIDRRFFDRDVAMNLARIYFNEKNCKKLPDVLKGLDTIPEAAEMLAECGLKVRKVDASQTVKAKKLSPLMLTVRISGGVFVAGGATLGLIYNGVVIPDQVEKYRAAKTVAEVGVARKNIEDSEMLRNVCYALAGVGLAMVSVTFFF